MPVSGNHRPNAPIDKLTTAYAINEPAALGDDLFVVVPSASDNRSQVVAWAPKTPLPVAGDECLVAYDENGNPWVVAWVSDLRVGAPESISEAMLIKAVQEKLLGAERVTEAFLAKAIIKQLAGGTIKYGVTSTIKVPGTGEAFAEVTHGVGTTPKVVLVTGHTMTPYANDNIIWEAENVGATSFRAIAHKAAATEREASAYWLAIG